MQKKKWLSRSLLMTEQRLWTGTEPLARSVCLGLKVSSKLNWVAGTHPSFLFVSPAPVYFHYQYQIVIAGPCGSSWRGISLRGIASQRDPISPHPWSPPRIEWPSPGCRAPRWAPSCPASLEVSDSRWQSAQQRLILSFFSVGGVNSLAWEHLMFQRSVNRALAVGSFTPTPSLWVSKCQRRRRDKDRNSDGRRGGGGVQLGAS